MSQTETYRGTLHPLVTVGEFEDFCQFLLELNDVPTQNRWDDPCSAILESELSDKYVVVSPTVYQIREKEELEEDLFEVTELPNGDLSFIVQYYNGGCCFSEAIEHALLKGRN